MTPRHRYNAAHLAYQTRTYPSVVRDGHYTAPKYPRVLTSNGLTTFIINHMLWTGHFANRINVQGRMIGKIVTTQSGARFDDRRMIKSATKKGTADIDCIFHKRPVKIEVKIGRDTMSDKQIEYQGKVQSAGGVYIVVKTVEDYLKFYDTFEG